jgi:hypothetical protein
LGGIFFSDNASEKGKGLSIPIVDVEENNRRAGITGIYIPFGVFVLRELNWVDRKVVEEGPS